MMGMWEVIYSNLHRDWGCGSVEEYLPNIYKTLNSIPSTTKKKKLLKENNLGQAPVARAYNPHYSRSKDQDD
jgi:hypothetical protein